MATVAQPVAARFRNGFARSTVMGVAAIATTTPGADEASLAQRAAAGDGDAFATLYERYESRVYNLCFRILGSQDDAADAAQEAFVNVLRRLPKLKGRELAFGSYVFTSARNACYDLIRGRRRTEPSDEIPEHATPMGGGVGGGGTGFDPGDPGDDPERNVLLDARTEEIRLANLTLPERQREALALKELEELSYDEVAEIMGMNRNSVAQLISRARINLRDALRGAALGAIVPNSPQCERAVPLIASLDDGELVQESARHEWLVDHLTHCDLCRMRREAMEEAGVSYRAWLPISAGPFLFRETMAEAAELVGADWSEVVARRNSARSGAGPAAAGGSGGAGTEGARAAILRHRRLDIALMGLLGLILVLVAFVGPTTDGSPVTAILPAADEQQPATTAEKEAAEPAKKKEKKKSGGAKNRPAAAAPPGESAGQPNQPGEESASTDGLSSTGTSGDGSAQRRSSGGGKVDRDASGGSKDGVTGDRSPEPPPPADVTADPPPPPPPTETTPTDPGVCRDPATGAQIPCGTGPPTRPPPRTPPPTRTPP
jgi:RNA polymerase sigma-70 factor (ECF subfamily)